MVTFLLKIGAIFAIRQPDGTTLVFMDCWNICDKIGLILFAVYLKTRAGISSGPAAFDGLRLHSNLHTPACVILIFGIEGRIDLPLSGKFKVFPLAKTQLN